MSSKRCNRRKPEEKRRREELARKAEENWRRKNGITNRCVESHNGYNDKK
jgi:ribosomal protein L32E